MKFRKRPVVIEAVKVEGALYAARDDWRTLPEWLREAYDDGKIVFAPDGVHIETLEGNMLGTYGDWIIRGVKGELYPCKPDIFEATYSPADEQEQAIPGLPPYTTHAWVRVKQWYPEITRLGVYDEESKLWCVAGWRGFLYTSDIELVAPMQISKEPSIPGLPAGIRIARIANNARLILGGGTEYALAELEPTGTDEHLKQPQEQPIPGLPERSRGIALIAAERARQIEKEGWTPEHDDAHTSGEMALAAIAYAAVDYEVAAELPVLPFRSSVFPEHRWRDPWPWDSEWDKRKTHSKLRRLEIAGALIAAEIDRLLRAESGVIISDRKR